MRCLAFLTLIVLVSCKKEKTISSFPPGIYVEETLRLDTIDFTVNNLIDWGVPQFELKTKPFIEPQNPNWIIYNSANYQFVIKNNNTIDLRSMLSSNSNYQNFYFNWNSATIFFEIDKFYYRTSLPARLRFVKL